MAVFSGLTGGGRPRRRTPSPPTPRDVQAEQRARGGLSDAAEAAAQDDFVQRLMRDAEAAERASPWDQMSPAARRALARAEEPVAREKFVHETDVGNAESIRRGGIRRSRGGGAMGTEGVYAYRGGAEGRRVPEGRALIEFEADPGRILGRGTTPGSRTVALQGDVSPGDITGGYSSSGRLFNLLGGTPYHGLYSLVAGMFGLPDFRTPADLFLQNLIPMSESSPYNPIYTQGVPA